LSTTLEPIIYIRKCGNPSTTSLDQLSDIDDKKKAWRGGRDIDSDFFKSILSVVEKQQVNSIVLRPLSVVQEAI
jgi:hypothetical protein